MATSSSISRRWLSVTPELARTLADLIGDVLLAPMGSTWIRLRTLPRASYAESGGAVPPDVQPVFVVITASRQPVQQRAAQIFNDIASTVAGATGHPKENVHVLFEPDAAGRIAFGGRPVE